MMCEKKSQYEVPKINNTPWIIVCHIVDGNMVDAVNTGHVNPQGGGFFGG